jgi:hypothetical protein
MISNVWLAAIILVIWTALVPSRGSAALSQACAENVGRIAALDGASQRKALKSLLSGNFLEEHESLGCLFYYGDRLRQPLRALLRDPKFGARAVHLLGLVGEPNVLSLLLVRPPSLPTNRWAYDVVCMMLEPASDEEWAFLRKAAFNGFDDRWVDYGAIQTLKLIASPRSRQILEESRQRNPKRAKVVAAALDYIRSNPSPLSDRNLELLAKRTAEAVKIGKLEGVETPQYNQEHDKALVDFLFNTGSDELIYTATFHNVAGVWRLRGVRETMQAMVPARIPPPPPPPSLILPPPPDLPFDPPTIPPLFPLLQPKGPSAGPPLLHQRG